MVKESIKQVISDWKAYFRYLKYKNTLPEKMMYDDLYIVEFPKSGVTWLTFILSNIIIKENNLKNNVNFFNSNDFIIDIHTSNKELFQKLETPGYRIFKSHSEFNPFYRKIVYLWRDPKDVMKSYYRMMTGLGYYNGSYLDFVQNEKYGIHAWIRHISHWINKSNMNQRIYFINYENLKKNTEEEIKKLLSSIGWDVKQESISDAIKKSDIKQMQLLEDIRFKNDIRWQADRIKSKEYRFVGNKIEIENEQESNKYITKVSNKFLENLISISSNK